MRGFYYVIGYSPLKWIEYGSGYIMIRSPYFEHCNLLGSSAAVGLFFRLEGLRFFIRLGDDRLLQGLGFRV